MRPHRFLKRVLFAIVSCYAEPFGIAFYIPFVDAGSCSETQLSIETACLQYDRRDRRAYQRLRQRFLLLRDDVPRLQ